MAPSCTSRASASASAICSRSNPSSPTERQIEPQLEPVLEQAPELLLHAAPEAALLPLLGRDRLGVRQVVPEQRLHFGGEFGAEDDDIHLVVVQKAAPVDIR